MKQIYFLLIAFIFLATSCKKENDSKSSDSIGGSTDLPMNAVDNEFFGSVVIGNNYVETNESVVVTKSENGIITIKAKATLPSSPLTDLIPASYKDASGNLDVEGKFKNTSEGILDYTNSDGKPFVLVRYDSNVGDTYVLEKSNGSRITRTVTAKTTTDDYPYGFLLIKTITVEQDSRIPGVSKIVYKANHKFGLVGIEFVMEDGTSSKISVFSVN